MSSDDGAASAQDPKNLPVEFQFDSTPVRTIAKEGQAWFVAKDVCEILEHSNHRMAVANLDNDEKGVSIVDTPGGPQETTIINESGLYALIFTSRKPEAKRFRKWVTSQVLPAIRQTGRYGSYSDKDPDRSSSGRSTSASDPPTSSPTGSIPPISTQAPSTPPTISPTTTACSATR